VFCPICSFKGYVIADIVKTCPKIVNGRFFETVLGSPEVGVGAAGVVEKSAKVPSTGECLFVKALLLF